MVHCYSSEWQSWRIIIPEKEKKSLKCAHLQENEHIFSKAEAESPRWGNSDCDEAVCCILTCLSNRKIEDIMWPSKSTESARFVSAVVIYFGTIEVGNVTVKS